MNILGVAFLSDASAAVVKDGKLVSAVSEERINRIKQWNGIPLKAVDAALQLAGISLEEVDIVATHGQAPPEPDMEPFDRVRQRILSSNLNLELKEKQLDKLQSRYDHEKRVLGQRTPDYIAAIRGLGRPVQLVCHHEAHAATAYFGSGWDDCVVITADGWGEDGSATVWLGRDGRIELLHRSATIDSLGYFYGSVTKALGFIPHRHEGKVLGLAAYCESPRSYPAIRGMIDYDSARKSFVGRMEGGLYAPNFSNEELKQYIEGYSREDVASSAQTALEEVVCAMVRDLGGKGLRIALAGGLFANVKLNQRIANLENVAEIFVFPNMGDGGLSVGAAWQVHARLTGARPEPLRTALLGQNAPESEIVEQVAQSGLSYSHEQGIEKKIAELLAGGNVVAHFDGRMEFGPRALGNRSILYKAVDPSVNKWLNDRLSRSEFMPFAPATLEERAHECYIGLDKARSPAGYMAVTFDCTKQMRAQSPAAVHVDGTARPQLVSESDYPRFHAILENYYKLTGNPSIINTSFNMHEEPIVCTVEDAIRAFKAAGLPYLILGDFLVRGEERLLD